MPVPATVGDVPADAARNEGSEQPGGAGSARTNAHAECGVEEVGDRLLLVYKFSECASDGCPCMFG